MFVLVIVAAFLTSSGQEIPLYRMEIPARSEQDCLDALEDAVLQPYVVYAMCEERHAAKAN